MQTLLDEGRAIIPIPQYISLFSLLLFPCSFPVTIKPKIVYSSVYEEIHVIFASQITKFPVFFPVNGNFGPETGSQETESSASQSADQRIVL